MPQGETRKATKSARRKRSKKPRAAWKPSLAAPRVTNPTWQRTEEILRLSSAVILATPALSCQRRGQRSAPPGAPSCSALQPRTAHAATCPQSSACLRPSCSARRNGILTIFAAGELVPVDLSPADYAHGRLVEQYAGSHLGLPQASQRPTLPQ